MSEVHNGLPYRSFDEIPEEVEVSICAVSKHLYTPYCGASNKITKTFSYHSAPKTSCPAKKHNKTPCYTTYGTPTDAEDEENAENENSTEEQNAESSGTPEAAQPQQSPAPATPPVQQEPAPVAKPQAAPSITLH